MVVPLIQVSHLPSASSFYASLTQTLGLRYLCAEPLSPACLHYGYRDLEWSGIGGKDVVVFSVKQYARPLLSRVVIEAPTPQSVEDFLAKAELLNTGCTPTFEVEEDNEGEEEGYRATTKDFDGNIVEAVFCAAEKETEETRDRDWRAEMGMESLPKEQRRVLEWQEGVARSVLGDDDIEVGARERVGLRRADTFPRVMTTGGQRGGRGDGRYRQAQVEVEREDQRERDSLAGFDSKTVFGTIIGAAAGAAFAYSMMQAESPPPRAVRRATFSNADRGGNTNYTHSPGRERERILMPERSGRLLGERERERERPRYVQYTIAAPPKPAPLSRIEERSYVSRRTEAKSGGGARERSRSEVGPRYYQFERRPLTILPAKSTHTQNTSYRERRREESGGRTEYESVRIQQQPVEYQQVSEYVETRSHHSGSSHTMRPSLSRSPRGEKVVRAPSPPPAASYLSTTTIKVVPEGVSPRRGQRENGRREGYPEREREREPHVQHREREREREIHVPHRERERESRRDERDRSSSFSARQVPVPRSMVSGVGYGNDNYAASVAPSDSVSSVGTKREKERLRERMGVRVGGGPYNGGW